MPEVLTIRDYPEPDSVILRDRQKPLGRAEGFLRLEN